MSGLCDEPLEDTLARQNQQESMTAKTKKEELLSDANKYLNYLLSDYDNASEGDAYIGADKKQMFYETLKAYGEKMKQIGKCE